MAFGAAKSLCDSHCYVIGGQHNHGLDGVLDRNGRARTQKKLRRRLDGRVSRNRDRGRKRHLPVLQLLEQKIERHHLGEGRRMTQRVSVTGVKRAPGLSIQNEGSVLFGSGQLKDSVRRLPAPAARGVYVARDVDTTPVPDVDVMPMDRSGGSCRSQARCREPYSRRTRETRESPTPRPAYARERFR